MCYSNKKIDKSKNCKSFIFQIYINFYSFLFSTMNSLSILLLIYFTTTMAFANIVINKVVVRIPKPNDIGLIFGKFHFI